MVAALENRAYRAAPNIVVNHSGAEVFISSGNIIYINTLYTFEVVDCVSEIHL